MFFFFNDCDFLDNYRLPFHVVHTTYAKCTSTLEWKLKTFLKRENSTAHLHSNSLSNGAMRPQSTTFLISCHPFCQFITIIKID